VNDFVAAFRCECIKTKRSLGVWLVVVGAFFTPAIVTVARLLNHAQLPAVYGAESFWLALWKSSWESMAIFFLPMAAILATSLSAQIEFRNNAWKQVHTLPLGRTTLFFVKFAVTLGLMALFLVLFDVGIYLSAFVPWLLLRAFPYPSAPLPLGSFLQQTLLYFIDCLPIVAAQTLLSLQFRNFLVPIGVGFLTWVAALAGLSWKFGYLMPYAYTLLNYLHGNPSAHVPASPVDVHLLAAAYAIVLTATGHVLFVTRSYKG
jgi:hypothetical protein